MTAVLPTPIATAGPDLPTTVGASLQVPLVTGGLVPYANLDLAASAPALTKTKPPGRSNALMSRVPTTLN